jgi:hypothetical protein
MREQRLYYELNPEDGKVRAAWHRKLLALAALISVVAVGGGAVLALESLTTPEDRMARLQWWGAFP